MESQILETSRFVQKMDILEQARLSLQAVNHLTSAGLTGARFLPALPVPDRKPATTSRSPPGRGLRDVDELMAADSSSNSDNAVDKFPNASAMSEIHQRMETHEARSPRSCNSPGAIASPSNDASCMSVDDDGVDADDDEDD
ncbi:hypothetical protein FHG87_002825, partial [Trinorchestia longiramus]